MWHTVPGQSCFKDDIQSIILYESNGNVKRISLNLLFCYIARRDVPQDCTGYYERGNRSSGVHEISPDGINLITVYCDLAESPTDRSEGGGWLVFQRRVDASVDFYRFVQYVFFKQRVD